MIRKISYTTLILVILMLPVAVNSQSLVSVTPPAGIQSSSFPITITGLGTSWQNTPYSYINLVFSGLGVTDTNLVIADIHTLNAYLAVSFTAPIGFRDVEVRYWTGGALEISWMQNGFEVLKALGTGDGPVPFDPHITLHPNPYSNKLSIEYMLEVWSHVLVDIYDIKGNKITTLIDEEQNRGLHRHQLNTVELELPVGLLLLRIEVDGQSFSEQLLHIK